MVKRSRRAQAAASLLEGEEEAPSLGPNALGVVADMAGQILTLDNEIAALLAAVEEKQVARAKLAKEQLPETMLEMKVKNVTLDNGAVVSIKEFLSASIPAETTIENAPPEEQPRLRQKREKALAWLRKVKAGHIIKHEIRASIPKGEEALLKRVMAAMKKLKVAVTDKEAVHAGTLASFIRERKAQGAAIPDGVIDIYEGREAVIKLPKEPTVTKRK